MRSSVIGVGTLLLSTLVFGAGDDAQADKPRSPAAVNAITKHDVAVNRAQLEAQRAIAAADKQLLTDLDGAMAIALKAANVDEVKRIDAEKKEVEAGTRQASTLRGGPSLIGNWHTHSVTGESTYALSPTEVLHSGASEHGLPVYQGNRVTIHWPSGWVEIWTLSAEHAVIESWDPEHAAQAPSAMPTSYGFAVRANDEKPRR